MVATGPEIPVAWAANVWRRPQQVAIASIGEAARHLRSFQRNWAAYAVAHHRRTALIVEKLPSVSARPLEFGAAVPTAPLGSFMLIDPGNLLFAADCSSPFVNGEVAFVEDKEGPPSRAYLKLWEALTRIGVRPSAGETCLDLGSAPGGWTHVLAGLGAEVISVDKADLDPRVLVMPGVRHLRESAFGLDPRDMAPVDWLFSDVICYPQRLLTLVNRWLAAGKVKHFVCTIKFQGKTDFASLEAFRAIPGSQLMHLHNNKHELTWVKL